jgi:hypothetical protein
MPGPRTRRDGSASRAAALTSEDSTQGRQDGCVQVPVRTWGQ